MTAHNSRKLPGIEVLRAAAALTVMLSHGFLYKLFPDNRAIAMVFNYATEAVIVFFVLSGAVISLNHEQDVGKGKAAARNYVIKRLVRIYPIFLLALAGSYLVALTIERKPIEIDSVIGNLAFLQSLGGYIVRPPSTNPALWSLGNEMTYYLCFMLVILLPVLRRAWWMVAAIAAAAVGHVAFDGVAGHFLTILSLAPAWLIGSELARRAVKLPPVSPGFGICSMAIGLIWARCSMTTEFYDPFRLNIFALFCAPLVLATIQGNRSAPEYRIARFAAFGLGAALLWSGSNSILLTKTILTTAGVGACVVPVRIVDAMLERLDFLRDIFARLGSISYALYAIHLPILFAIKPLGLPSALASILFICSVIAVSAVLELVLQPKISRSLRDHLRSSRETVQPAV